MTWDVRTGFHGRSVIVTGAAGGIGGAVARAVAEAGGTIVAVDLPGSPVAELADSLAGSGHVALTADLTDTARHDSLVATAESRAPLVGLFHAAGVIRRRASVDEVTEQDFDVQLDTNLKTTFFLDRACWRVLRDGRGGSIVNVASQGWWSGGFGGSAIYSASKGGVVSLTRGLARTFASDGVRVNAIAPGLVDTPMLREGVDAEQRQAFVDMVPLGRLGDPDDLSGAAVFLLSEASAYVTGAVINVSGGQLMY